ncbi:MAG: prolipoprotein diacylglyceryl transferase [Spirochaetales bacterium]|nr:prolipoprotein diacylglyceryl transferase [Spirochaetales bacterium]
MTAYIHFPSWLKPEIIPGLPIRWYSLMYLVAFGITYILFLFQVKKRKLDIPEDDIINYFFWSILSLLLGARIFAVLVYDSAAYYLSKPWLIFWPFNAKGQFTGLQGLSYHGGLIGAVLGSILYCRRKKYDWFDWADMTLAGVPLGYTFGRLGNFINGELWGRVTASRWGMVFPHARSFPAEEPWVQENAERAGMDIVKAGRFINLPRHPSQLYEAFFEGILLWAVIWFVFRKRKKHNGSLVGIYLIGYGLVRFFIEYFRQPDENMGFPLMFGPKDNPVYLLLSPFNFSTGQILCLGMILFGALFLLYTARRKPVMQEQEKPKKELRKIRKKIP